MQTGKAFQDRRALQVSHLPLEPAVGQPLKLLCQMWARESHVAILLCSTSVCWVDFPFQNQASCLIQNLSRILSINSLMFHDGDHL
jgi:hypothetical protein